MDNDKPKWKRFREKKFDSKAFAKRAKKAETATVRHARKFITKRLDNLQDVRRYVAVWLTGIALLILTVGAQLVWVQRSYTVEAPVSGGTYAEAMLGPVKTLNPLYASSNAERSTASLVFSSLFDYDVTGHLQGDVAKSVSANKTGDVYTVKLRPQVRWHDEAPLTARDVTFTVDLMKDPLVRSRYRSQWQDIKAKVIDDTTIEFTLASPFTSFPHVLTFPILPKHILQHVELDSLRENAFSVQPVGSGPFEMRLIQSDGNSKIINLKRFDGYFKGDARLSRFEIHAYNSQDDIAKAVKAHQVTAAVDIKNAAALKDTSGYTVKHYPVSNGVYAFLNTSQGPLKDINVRRALQEGLDVAKLRQTVGNEYRPLDLPFVQGQLEGSGIPRVPMYNTKKASLLLTKAGWKLRHGIRMKKGKELSVTVATVNDPQFEKAIDVMKESWQKLGVKVDKKIVDVNDPASNFYQTVLQPRAYDVLVYELSIGADPDVYAFWHSSQVGPEGLNLSVYKNGVADDTLGSARAQQNHLLRELKYKAFAKQWVKDVPAIGLYQSSMLYVQNDSSRAIRNDQVLVSPYDRYANVTYWTTDHASVYKTP